MIVHVDNRFEGRKTEDVAKEMVGERMFIGWPFLQEGLVVAVSDHLFRHEKIAFGKNQKKVLATPHGQDALHSWHRKTERIEHMYSKRCGVIIGQTEMLVHVRPLKGLKRLDSGALIKEYETEDKETEQVAQLAITGVESEDPRYLEKDAPPLHEEFPAGSKIFFLGDHAYGVAAQVSETTDTTLSVILAFFPSDVAENETFTRTVNARTASRYLPSYRVSEVLEISPLALSRITSSFMVITSDGQKNNLGLSLKFEAKSMKVLDYSQKSANGRGWEYSEKTIQLIRDYKTKFPSVFLKLDLPGDTMVRASDMFPGGNADVQVKEVRGWLSSQGVRDFEPVSLFCDQLKTATVAEIEKLADGFNANKSSSSIKKAIVKGIPRQAVLKPSHAIYKLQNQRFALGDRVIMVQDSGGVPLCAKGVVIGLNNSSMDVVWDVPFLSGTDLGGRQPSNRCSQYRGSTCAFNSCLNLTQPQFVMSNRKQQAPPSAPFQPQIGPHPMVRPRGGHAAASGFRPAPHSPSPMQIMTNPHRGRGGAQQPPVVSYGAAANGRRSIPQTGDIPNGHINSLRSTINEGLPNGPPIRRVGPVQPQGPAPTSNSRGGFGPHPRGGIAFNPSLSRGGQFRGRGFAARGGPFARGFQRGGRGRGDHVTAPAVQS
ncbi:hypothetical protein K439DRAFT_1328052 [Ramaria rubella]|nr:hypothetical protein K439DRAFT_1328052 [Ramaria rubella]